jgi:hypothetical protein
MKCGGCDLTYTTVQTLVCKVDGKAKVADDKCTRPYEACEVCKKQNKGICRLKLMRIPDITEVPEWCPKKGDEKR